MGWYLTVYLIFQILALVLQKQQPQRDPASRPKRCVEPVRTRGTQVE